mmetsp:Transcript_4142/g.10514  ORF Transcript_4142/g.10514 Transcript_4142/m.10514 type:complete len:657 (+) Transcript_4142:198-2168(+)
MHSSPKKTPTATSNISNSIRAEGSPAWSTILQRIAGDASEVITPPDVHSPVPAATPATRDSSKISIDCYDEGLSIHDDVGTVDRKDKDRVAVTMSSSPADLPPPMPPTQRRDGRDRGRNAIDDEDEGACDACAPFTEWARSGINVLAYIMGPPFMEQTCSSKGERKIMTENEILEGNDTVNDAEPPIEMLSKPVKDDDTVNGDVPVKVLFDPPSKPEQISLLETVVSSCSSMIDSFADTVVSDIPEIGNGRLGIAPIHIMNNVGTYKSFTSDNSASDFDVKSNTKDGAQWGKSQSQMMIESNLFAPENPIIPFDTFQYPSTSIDDLPPSPPTTSHSNLESPTQQKGSVANVAICRTPDPPCHSPEIIVKEDKKDNDEIQHAESDIQAGASKKGEKEKANITRTKNSAGKKQQIARGWNIENLNRVKVRRRGRSQPTTTSQNHLESANQRQMIVADGMMDPIRDSTACHPQERIVKEGKKADAEIQHAKPANCHQDETTKDEKKEQAKTTHTKISNGKKQQTACGWNRENLNRAKMRRRERSQPTTSSQNHLELATQQQTIEADGLIGPMSDLITCHPLGTIVNGDENDDVEIINNAKPANRHQGGMSKEEGKKKAKITRTKTSEGDKQQVACGWNRENLNTAKMRRRERLSRVASH